MALLIKEQFYTVFVGSYPSPIGPFPEYTDAVIAGEVVLGANENVLSFTVEKRFVRAT